MSMPLHQLALDSANRVLTEPKSSPGEMIGSTLCAQFGLSGVFVGGTVGRMIESKLFG